MAEKRRARAGHLFGNPYKSSVARLIHAMGFMEPSDCSCTGAAPNSSTQASQYTWNGREPSATASQLGKTRIGGVPVADFTTLGSAPASGLVPRPGRPPRLPAPG